MSSIADIFIDGLNFNQGINFYTVLVCFGIYMAFFWLAVCVWVYTDVVKRYHDRKLALWISGAVFLLFFPALILYLAVRRPHVEEHGYFDDMHEHGVNIPVVNFTGEDGVRMSFDLNIYPTKKSDLEQSKDMKINVSWESENDKFEKVERVDDFQEIIPEGKHSSRSKNMNIGRRLGKVRNSFLSFVNNVKGGKKKSIESDSIERHNSSSDSEEREEEASAGENNRDKQNHKHRNKKNKKKKRKHKN